MKILVIDDDCNLRELITEVLQEKYTVIQANNGKKGLEILDNDSSIDLIITDIIMPDVDGIEVVYHIKKNYPHIKVLAISGGGRYGTDSYLESAEIIGCDASLRKPFSNIELMAAIEKIEVR